jgi:6-phosphofructokinase 1
VSTARGNLLVLQSGGPTPVLNTTLFGVLDEASRHSQIGRVFGARFGFDGLLKEDLLDLSALSRDQVAALKTAPGASLGTSREKASDVQVSRILEMLREFDARWLLIIGGNGSLRGAEAIATAAHESGDGLVNGELTVIGIPKTIDNDIEGTDRCPGFASAAKYVAQSVRDLAMDVRTLRQPVSIFETMGRNAGWLAASSILARQNENDAPHLVYLPERAFDPATFLKQIDQTVTRHGWAIAVVCEGLNDANGRPVFEATDASQRDAMGRAMPGGVAQHLASMVTRELKIRCRSERPGLVGRTLMPLVAEQDKVDAEFVGRFAVRHAIEDETASGKMVSLLPLESNSLPPAAGPLRWPCPSANRHTRIIPTEFLGPDAIFPVSESFIQYTRRLVGRLIEYPAPLCESPLRVHSDAIRLKETSR